MEDQDVLAERFEAHRARLRAIAYQTLGSASEADDAVQEAWLRLSRSDPGSIENLGGWLTTVVARVCLNMLQARREQPAGIHLPGSVAQRRGRHRPRAGSAARRLHRSRATGNPAHAAARRAARLRPARHVRRPVRRHRAHRRALARRGPPAGQPRPPAGPGRGPGPRHRPDPAASHRRRVPHRRPQRRLRRAAGGTRPRRRGALQRRRDLGPRCGGGGRHARSPVCDPPRSPCPH